MSLELVLSIAGLVFGALGAASGYYTFVLSGHRVKVKVGIAVMQPGGFVQIDRKWRGGFGNIEVQPNQLQFCVRVLNRGRTAAQVEKVALGIKKHHWNRRTNTRIHYLQAPIGKDGHAPHKVDAGLAAVWLINPSQSTLIADEPSLLGLSQRRRSLFAEVTLADDLVRVSRKSLTPGFRDRFARELIAHNASMSLVDETIEMSTNVDT